MATFTDTLLTIFTTQGVAGYQAAMNAANQAAQRAAVAQGRLNQAMHAANPNMNRVRAAARDVAQALAEQTRAQQRATAIYREATTSVLGLAASFSGLGAAMYPVFFAFYRSNPQVQLIAAAFLALTGVLKATNAEFVKFEETYTKMRLALAHSGLSINTQELRDYARARSEATGIDENATLALAEQLVNLRATGDQVRRLLPLIQSAAISGHGSGGGTGGNVDATQLAASLAKSVETGNLEALENLGLDPKKVQQSANRVEEIIRQMTIKFGDNAEIMAQTLGRQQDIVNQKWKNTLTDLGELFEPLQRLWAGFKGFFIDVLDGWVLFIRKALAALTFGLSEVGRDNAGKAIAEKTASFQKDALRYLGNIDRNTEQFTTTMARAVLGGTGSSRRINDAATIRNFTPFVRQAF